MFGIWGHKDAAQISYYGLHALQHRGQEGAGIVTKEGKKLHVVKGEGLVNDVFSDDAIKKLKGNAAIAHVLYATEKGRGIENVQPLVFRSTTGSLSIAFNGNIVNAVELREHLERQGSIFQTASDTEVLAHLVKRATSGTLNQKDRVKKALSLLKGAFSFVMLTEDSLMVAQDPNTIRPLSLGKMGDAWVVASETCAFDIIGAESIRSVEPGELIIINESGMKSEQFAKPADRAMCSMEYAYFARPDSNIDGVNIHSARKRCGKQLAREVQIEADVVTGVPDSSISAAIGFSEVTGIPYELGLIKNRYVGRTFIQPTQEMREKGVKMKLSPVQQVVEGKRVVMVDDSIVRGTTSKRIVKMLKEAGAKEVHVMIATPPLVSPCYYGVDISTDSELIATNRSIEEIRELIGADSLAFLSIEGMLEAVGRSPEMENCGQCLACFTGDYPTEIYADTVMPHEKEIVR